MERIFWEKAKTGSTNCSNCATKIKKDTKKLVEQEPGYNGHPRKTYWCFKCAPEALVHKINDYKDMIHNLFDEMSK